MPNSRLTFTRRPSRASHLNFDTCEPFVLSSLSNQQPLPVDADIPLRCPKVSLLVLILGWRLRHCTLWLPDIVQCPINFEHWNRCGVELWNDDEPLRGGRCNRTKQVTGIPHILQTRAMKGASVQHLPTPSSSLQPRFQLSSPRQQRPPSSPSLTISKWWVTTTIICHP